jgi:hypothetical protein
MVAVLGTEGRRGLARLRAPLGALILALAALPWVVPYYVASHGQFQSEVLAHHYGAWLLRGSFLARVDGVAQTLLNFLPWSIFLAAAVWTWRGTADGGRRRIALWTATVWTLLVFTGIPRSQYLLPLYPLLALLTADGLAQASADERPLALRAAAYVASIYAAGVALVLLLRPTLLARGEDATLLPAAGWERGFVAVLLVGGAIAVGLFARRHAWSAVTVAVALSLAGTFVVTGIRYPARYAHDYDVRPLAAVVASHTGPGGTLFGYPDLRLAYDFYLGRPAVEVGGMDQVRRLLDRPEPGQVLITSRDRWQELSGRASSSWHVLAARTLADREIVVVGTGAP